MGDEEMITPKVMRYIANHGPLTKAEIQKAWELGRTLDKVLSHSMSYHYVRKVQKKYCRRQAYEITEIGRAYLDNHVGRD